jgi:hypothetical protein
MAPSLGAIDVDMRRNLTALTDIIALESSICGGPE